MIVLEIITGFSVILLYACTLLLSWRAGYYTGCDREADDRYDNRKCSNESL